jgi:hypothetical protein
LRASIGTPQTSFDRFRSEHAIARSRLDAANFEAAWAAGGALLLSQAIEEALKTAAS